MKIVSLAALLLMLNVTPLTPNNTTGLMIPVAPAIVTVQPLITFYKPLINAIYKHESNENPLAYNPKEGATGGLQIRLCRLEHFNKLTKKNYTLADMYDMNKAIEVFLYFTNHDGSGNLIPRKSFEVAARNWNGRWEKTEGYWKKVKELIHI